MTGDVEEAVLEMYLSGISVRKIAGVTEALSRVKVGKDAVSRIARRLEEEQREWRERSLGEKSYPYLYLERVMNLGENRIGKRILRLARSPAVPRFPHSQAIPDRVHNSL